VIVELGRLSFIDSSGLNALVRAHQVAQKSGTELRLRHLRPMLLQLLHITHLETVFVIDEHEHECEAEPDSPDPTP
jgi:anti-anti-sigma factor